MKVYVKNVVEDDEYGKNRRKFDIIAADFPDPHDEAISKLYSVEFFFLIRRAMKNNGLFVTQSTSPLFAKDAFWCINNTLKKVFKRVAPYHVYVPTFGDWGFNIASNIGFNYRNLNDEKIKSQPQIIPKVFYRSPPILISRQLQAIYYISSSIDPSYTCSPAVWLFELQKDASPAHWLSPYY